MGMPQRPHAAVVRPLAERLRVDGPNPRAEGRTGSSAFSILPDAPIKGFGTQFLYLEKSGL